MTQEGNGFWSSADIWNESLKITKRYPPKERGYIYASEIGGSMLDRYLKMQGTAPTNPYDDRTLRKFAAGNYFEEIVEKMFKQIGVLKESQGRVEIPESEKHLKVSGRFDFLLGGLPDWNEARKRVKAASFPTAIESISMNLIAEYEVKYPQGLPLKLMECKSVNSMIFWSKIKNLFEDYIHHQLQAFTYINALDLLMGTVFYISKDDLTTAEIPVFAHDSRLTKLWDEDVGTFTEYWRSQKPPKEEPDYIWSDKKELWVTNWKKERSTFLTHITGKVKEKWISDVKKVITPLNKKIGLEKRKKTMEKKKLDAANKKLVKVGDEQDEKDNNDN